MDLLKKLENEITQQTRNGRENIYVDVNDLNELGYKIDENKQGRVYVDLSTLRLYMNKYKFKNSLKVETHKRQETFKDVQKDIEKIENQQPHKSWDTIEK